MKNCRIEICRSKVTRWRVADTRQTPSFSGMQRWRKDTSALQLLKMRFRNPSVRMFANLWQAASARRLLDDAGSTWSAAVSPGSGTASNSQCSLTGGGASAVSSGNDLTVTVPITFSAAYNGVKSTFALAIDSAGQNSGWKTAGTWTVEAPVGEPQILALSPTTGSGPSREFTAVFSHSGGVEEFYLGYILLLPSPNIVWFTAAGSCMIEFNRLGGNFDGKGGLRLINDDATNWTGTISGVPLVPTAGTLSNSRCEVNVGASRAVISGNTITVTVSVTFKTTMGGVLGTFLQAFDKTGKYTDMRQFGNWVAPGGTAKPGPSIAGLTPPSGTGANATFAMSASHSRGVNQLGMLTMLIADKIVGGTPCQVIYFPVTNLLNLINDDGTQLVSLTGITPGSGTLANSRCTVNGVGAVRSASANTVAVSLPMTFNSATFGGSKIVYLNAFDIYGNLTHWITTGTWTVQ